MAEVNMNGPLFKVTMTEYVSDRAYNVYSYLMNRGAQCLKICTM